MKETTTALSKEEELALDRQLEQLEPQIADAKRKYDALVSQYAELFLKNVILKSRRTTSRRHYFVLIKRATERWNKSSPIWRGLRTMVGNLKGLV